MGTSVSPWLLVEAKSIHVILIDVRRSEHQVAGRAFHFHSFAFLLNLSTLQGYIEWGQRHNGGS
jgi:hypothetical protein